MTSNRLVERTLGENIDDDSVSKVPHAPNLRSGEKFTPEACDTPTGLEKAFAEIQHYCNPLHFYCRRIKGGWNKSLAKSVSQGYERFVFKPFINAPINAYFWTRNAIRRNGNNGRARVY